MKDYRKIIISPIITEKSSRLKEEQSLYVFEVDINSNKHEIKTAVEKLFNVNVLEVNTVKRKGKVKRTRFIPGRRKNTKKAYVKIKPDQRIDVFEGA